MQGQKQELFKRIAAHGWTLTEIEDWGLDWWADETWQLKSVWSPVDCCAYLTFLVDPHYPGQWRKKNEKVWAVMVSPSKPESWAFVPDSFTLFLNGWQRDLPNFLKHLSALRQDCVN